MKIPRKPTKPTEPRKIIDEHKTNYINLEYITIDDFESFAKDFNCPIKDIKFHSVVHDDDPYDYISIERFFLVIKKITNPDYEKQYTTYTRKMKAYKEKLKLYRVAKKEYDKLTKEKEVVALKERLLALEKNV